jgi:tetratricopeptide (TPR) repeat protein
MNDEALFYLGRSLLAAGQSTEALDAFSQAEILRPDNPQYALWKGAAYQAIGAVEEERQTYRQLIDKRPDLLPARLNLANNLLQDGQASQAQQLYEQILESDPTERTALYNRAIALRLQGKPEEEAGAWKIYLDYHRAGISASRAMQHLYELGDYSYRNYQLGEKSVILNQDRLLNPQGRERAKEIDYLARQLNKRSLGDLNIVVFVQDDAQQAKSIAHSLRSAITDRTDGLENDSIGVSWFDEAEPIETLDKDKINLSKGVLIFSAPTNNPNMEKRI